ncbi:phage major capsid protein [Romboutsia timonensis]|uniref:phage major capsid protein n=1 Tax=Romboutsia timonensis TaxID=1776391 RepID=UPI002A82578C|nr:phage major capsid protein [Romboutsia timonensis]MDY3960174.1 phage major capsid protein [Romboutsia timonensis]
MKGLLEKKNSLLDELEGIVDKAKTEVRAFTEEEDARVEAIKKEIRGLEKIISESEEIRSFDKNEIETEIDTKEKKTEEETRSLEIEKEERAFIEAVKSGELRNLTVGANGTIIPVSIASDIIDTVKESCPLLNHADIYHVAGDLRLPKYNGTLEAGYVTEFQDLVEKNATFTTIELKNQIIGVLTKISKSLINRAEFDVRGYIVEKVAKAIVDFLEKEMLVGATRDKIEGAIKTTNVVTAAANNALNSTDLVDVQMAVPSTYQKNCMWIMHKNILKALRKLKTADGQFVLNADATAPFGYTILGRPVYLSDSMPDAIVADKDVMLYMDTSGYAVKMTKNIEIQLLMEKYAAQYAIGVCAFAEIDAKIADTSKIARLKMAA